MNEHEKLCVYCGQVLDEENVYEFHNKVMCEGCFNEHTAVCECCNDRIWQSESRGDESITLCYDCYDDYYTTCEDCGRVIHNDSVCYESDDSDVPYCESCYDRINNAIIKSYNFKPKPIFYGSDSMFMGVELEIDKGGECIENAETLLDIANKYNEHIYCKHDGSIEDGFEIVSHPMTLDYHINKMNWKEIFHKAIDMGYRSHQTSTCGLHIHIGRDALGSAYSEQESVIARIVHFVELHWNELLKFSRRTEESINRWASRYGIADNTKETYKKAKSKGLGRYVAVNITNCNTIEFRMFRGTLRYKTFIATLQLVSEIYRCAISMSDKEMESLSWSDFVLNIPTDYQYLIDYLKSKRLYVNDIENEGDEI